MELTAIKMPLVAPGANLEELLLDKLTPFADTLEGSLLVVSAKVISVARGNLAAEDDYENLIKERSSLTFGDLPAQLTITQGIPIPNAGIDKSNSARGSVILWPDNLDEVAASLRAAVIREFDLQNFGVLLCDSCCWPLRKGTNAVCLACSGFLGVTDKRGHTDLHGRPLEMTQVAVADQLAAAANILMGEAADRKPFVLIKQPPVEFTNKSQKMESLQMPVSECIWGPLF